MEIDHDISVVAGSTGGSGDFLDYLAIANLWNRHFKLSRSHVVGHDSVSLLPLHVLELLALAHTPRICIKVVRLSAPTE
jgi:hypothetical protein